MQNALNPLGSLPVWSWPSQVTGLTCWSFESMTAWPHSKRVFQPLSLSQPHHTHTHTFLTSWFTVNYELVFVFGNGFEVGSMATGHWPIKASFGNHFAHFSPSPIDPIRAAIGDDWLAWAEAPDFHHHFQSFLWGKPHQRLNHHQWLPRQSEMSHYLHCTRGYDTHTHTSAVEAGGVGSKSDHAEKFNISISKHIYHPLMQMMSCLDGSLGWGLMATLNIFPSLQRHSSRLIRTDFQITRFLRKIWNQVGADYPTISEGCHIDDSIEVPRHWR